LESQNIYFRNNNTFGICEKGTIVFNLPNGISKCIEDVLYVLKLAKQLLLISQLIKQFFKVKFEVTKCWLKSFDFNKMIVKVVQERRIHKLVRVVESLVAKCNTKIKRNVSHIQGKACFNENISHS
jgi:hypothetical protein